jgi:excisionase family DNA binding protein
LKFDLDTSELAKEMVSLLTPDLIKALKPSSNSSDQDIIFDNKGLSKYLQVPESWVYKAVAQKSIPFFKCGSYNRFRKKDIDEWINRKSVTPYPFMLNQKVHKISN